MLIRPYSPTDWARPCVIHDAARLHELEAAGLSEAFLSLEDTAENEGLFDGEVLVAESEGQVQGFVAFTQHELTWLYVDPGKSRQGIGRRLLRRAIAACAAQMAGSPATKHILRLAIFCNAPRAKRIPA
jgi:GNAT superfamily N-acetyltransferase